MGILGNTTPHERSNGNPMSNRKIQRDVPQGEAETDRACCGNPGDFSLEDPSEHSSATRLSREHDDSSWHGAGHSTVGPSELTPDPRGRGPRNGALWFAVIILALVLFGELAYSYFTLRGENISISRIPEMFHSVGTLGVRMEAAEAKLRDLTANRDQLADRIAAVDRKANSTLQSARHQTQKLVEQVEGRLQSRMDQRARLVDSRLSQVERNQTEDRARLTQLNGQLEKEVADLRGELTDAQEGTHRDLASLHERASQNQDGLRDLTQRLQRERVKFEIVKNSPTELVPGVSLTVLKTNTDYQRFRGYVSLAADGRTLWLDNLGAHEALDLYPSDASHPYSLIITQVNPRGVVGYLLLPAGV
jgi:hypothetical protein